VDSIQRVADRPFGGSTPSIALKTGALTAGCCGFRKHCAIYALLQSLAGCRFSFSIHSINLPTSIPRISLIREAISANLVIAPQRQKKGNVMKEETVVGVLLRFLKGEEARKASLISKKVEGGGVVLNSYGVSIAELIGDVVVVLKVGNEVPHSYACRKHRRWLEVIALEKGIRVEYV
jgi:hypothetical protein